MTIQVKKNLEFYLIYYSTDSCYTSSHECSYWARDSGFHFRLACLSSYRTWRSFLMLKRVLTRLQFLAIVLSSHNQSLLKSNLISSTFVSFFIGWSSNTQVQSARYQLLEHLVWSVISNLHSFLYWLPIIFFFKTLNLFWVGWSKKWAFMYLSFCALSWRNVVF